jgi:hypothetical protein
MMVLAVLRYHGTWIVSLRWFLSGGLCCCTCEVKADGQYSLLMKHVRVSRG